jgi:NitT/TauT family transport system substrate-binding protein
MNAICSSIRNVLASTAVMLATLCAASAQTQTLAPISIGKSGGVSTAMQPLLYAQAAGLFKKRGLDVNIISMADDTTATLSLISGAYDMLFTGAGPGLIPQSKGAEFKIVSSIGPRSDYQFVAQKSITSLKDLEGKKIAVSKVGSVSYIAPVIVLRNANVDISKIQFLGLGNDAARGQALIIGTVDAAPLIGVQTALVLKAGPNLHIIADIGAQFSEFLYTAVFARDAAIKQKRASIAAAVEAMIEASRVLQSDKAVAVKQGIESGLPAEAIQIDYDALLASDVPYFGVNGGLNEKAIEAVWKTLKDDGSIATDLKYSAVVDPSFVDEAVKKLGPYKK